MLTIQVICIGKLKEKFYISACEEYVKRLGAYAKLEICELAESIGVDDVIRKIGKGAYIVPLCIEGDMLSSEELAKKVQNTTNAGFSKLCFLIGGSNGLPDEVKKLAHLKLSMSRMTFPHHFARVMLLEQIYRTFQINEGGKYHK